MVCEIGDGLVQIEMQVEPQDFWDIRILSCVCRLFQRQISRGFAWKQLVQDKNMSFKVGRVVGISIFANAPSHQSKLREYLPWYDAQPWRQDELRRHFRLRDETNATLTRPGIEFFDFNLAALLPSGSSCLPEHKHLRAWLEFFAAAHLKGQEDVEGLESD